MVKKIEVCPTFVQGEIEFGTIPKFAYAGSLEKELAAGMSREEAIGLLEYLLTIRAFEEMIIQIKGGKYLPVEGFSFTGATHLSIGQEAVAVGSMSAIKPDDYITSTHRGHGHAIAKGAYAIQAMDRERLCRFLGISASDKSDQELRKEAMDLHLVKTMGELLGKEEGYCRGRGGGMHIADFYVGHLGANAIVGGSYGIATGAGLSCQRLKNGKVVLCLAGDGAANNGICHESFNMACMDQFQPGLPVVYLIENNQYGMTGQQVGEVTGIDYLARRGAGYNEQMMHAEVVNGMDVLAVRDTVRRAAELARNGEGPVLLDVLTYRYMGHSLSDLRTSYRSSEEEEAWKACDPIGGFSGQVVDAGVMAQHEIDDLAAKVQERIKWATDTAARGTDPDPAGIYEGLLTDTTSEDIGEELRTKLDKEPRRPRRDKEGKILYRHAVWEALMEEMVRDRRVVLYGEDVADYGGAFQVTKGLLEIFGRDRVFNTAISEAAIVGSATGAAMTGLRPVAEIMYIDFILQAMDQVGNQAAKVRYMFGGKATVPMVIRTTIGGGKGYAGQHSQSLEAIVAHFPGLKIAAPSTAYDVKGLLKTAIRDDNPVIFIEHQLLYTEKGEVPEEEYTIPFGQAAIRREGKDLTLVSYSLMANVALEAAEKVAQEQGIEVEVIDPRTLCPLDVDTIAASVEKTGRLILVCQAPATGCFPEHIAYAVQEKALQHLKAPIKIIAAHDVPPPMAQPLEIENIPSPGKVAQGILELAGK